MPFIIYRGQQIGPSDLVVNTADLRQTIDGFGCVPSAYPMDSTTADLFFSQSAGIGLSLCRLSYATNSTGPSPWFPEAATTAIFFNNAILASARGAKVWAAPWSAMTPAWKTSNAFAGGSLLPAHFGDFATYCAGLQADLVANGGPTLYGMSVLNEPDFATTAYTSMTMTASDMLTYIKNNFGPALAGLSPRPLLIAPETENWDHAGTYLSTLSSDSTAYGFIDIIATHQYEGTVARLNTTKRVWMTEMSGIGGAFDASMANAFTDVITPLQLALTTGNVNAYHYFWNVNENTDNEALIGNGSGGGTDLTQTKRLYAMGNWSKFVRPGMVRVGTTGTVANVSITAFLNPSTHDFVVVAANSGGAVSPTIGLNRMIVSTVTPWLTDVSNNLAAQTPVSVVNSVFTAALTANSVTSFVGTGS